MKNEFNHNAVEDECSSRSGVYGLWLRVTCDAYNNLFLYGTESAEDFIFDRNNQFFDMVADQLNYEPDTLRKRIRQALDRRCRRGASKTFGIDEGYSS